MAPALPLHIQDLLPQHFLTMPQALCPQTVHPPASSGHSPSDAPSHPVISGPVKPQHGLQEAQQKLLGHKQQSCQLPTGTAPGRARQALAGVIPRSFGTGLQAASTLKGWSGESRGYRVVCQSRVQGRRLPCSYWDLASVSVPGQGRKYCVTWPWGCPGSEGPLAM